jgi:hypothetical protein
MTVEAARNYYRKELKRLSEGNTMKKNQEKKDLTRVPWVVAKKKVETDPTTTWPDDNNAEPLFVRCDCHSEGLETQYYREDENDKGFYVNYWKYGIEGRYSGMSLLDRLKYACKILFKGTLHGDQVILEVAKAEKVRDYLTKYLEYDKSIKDKK